MLMMDRIIVRSAAIYLGPNATMVNDGQQCPSTYFKDRMVPPGHAGYPFVLRTEFIFCGASDSGSNATRGSWPRTLLGAPGLTTRY